MKTREGSEHRLCRNQPSTKYSRKINGACLNKFKQVLYFVVTTVFQTKSNLTKLKLSGNRSMAEASIAVYGAAIGVAIALAVVTFSLRGKGHHEPVE